MTSLRLIKEFTKAYVMSSISHQKPLNMLPRIRN